jgi:hypothetical protein
MCTPGADPVPLLLPRPASRAAAPHETRKHSWGHRSLEAMTPRNDRVIFGLCVGLSIVFLVVSGITFGTVGVALVLLALLVVVLNLGSRWP